MVTRRRGRRAKPTTADAGALFDQQCGLIGLPIGEAERVFHPVRKWRLDRYWYPWQVALEIEGGLFKGHRTTAAAMTMTHCGDRLSPDTVRALQAAGTAAIGGRHNRGAGMREDMLKYNEAAVRDILVIRVMPEMITDGRAVVWVEAALKTHGWKPDAARGR